MKTILYNPIFINPQAYYVFPRLTRYLQPDNESTAEPANYIGTIEVKVIAYGDTTLKRTYTNTDSIDLSEFKNTWIRISLFTKVGSCVLGEWKIGNMESDLPYIDPEVLASLKAVVIVGNKTNNDSDRAIVKNLVDPDNPFVISNAAFKLNSGFGKYSADFESFDWAVNISQKQHNKATISLNGRLCNHTAIEVDEMKVNIIGNVTELIYWYIANPDDTTRSEIRLTSGINTLPKSYAKDDGQTYNIGFAYISGDSEITIEQIPSFEGAFVTDGIDDLIKSTKSATEMLDGSNEVTVVSMIHQIKTNSDVTRNNWFFTPVSYLENRVVENKTGKTGIYGYTSTNVTNAQISDITPILGDKNDYTLYSKIEDGDRDYFTVEGFQNQGIWYVSSIAWYWTIIANKVLTSDQINQVIAYFNLDRTLNPDILCNTIKQGITNENHEEFGDKLIDFSGNGRDIQLNNIAWKGDSGIGKYNFSNINIIANRFEGTVTTNKCHFTKKLINTTSNFCDLIVISPNEPIKFKVSGLSDGRKLFVANKSDSGPNYYFDNGEHEVSLSFSEGVGQNNPFGVTGDIGDIDVTVEFIPSHAGGLCLDGVNDFGKVTGMPIYKDYTVVADRELFNAIGCVLSNDNPGAFIFETSSASVYSFGEAATSLTIPTDKQIRYQTKYSYNGQNISIGAVKEGTSNMWLGTIRDNDARFRSAAIYSLMSFPYSMSEFLIERQLKKHKLGTLYPDMVEFRPVIKSNVLLDAKPTFVIRGTSTYLNAGDYVPENSQIWVSIKMNNIADRITKFTVNGKTIDIPENAYSEVTLQYGFPFVIDKSPQKISITIEQDENYVLFNPVINSNYDNYKLTFHLREYEKLINIGDYIPKGTYIRANLYLKNDIDELVTFTFNGVNINYAKSPVLDTAYNIRQIYNYDSPQEVNITIDEYIRYEDIVQPYPVLLRFNDENGNEVSWGGKFKVGSTITRIGSITDPESNLLNGLYSISGLSLNGKAVTSSTSIVEKQMVFRTTATYLLDNNEPKCILSPSRLRIPNSSYKLLGYIPDISGHGNHGVIHNSAYAEGSGVNEDGSYQFDGVDDFVTIPTTVGGKQVLMKVNWDTPNASILYDQRGNNNEFAIYNGTNDSDGNSIPAYQGRNNGQTYIDGILNSNIKASELRAITHNITITNELSSGTNKTYPIIGSSKSNAYFVNMALYDFMLFDEISTDDKILELNEYVGIEGNTE